MKNATEHDKKSVKDPDGIESREAGIGASLLKVGQILLRPELKSWRPTMAVALVLTIIAKCIAVASPLFFGDAINALSEDRSAFMPAMMGVAFWVAARFASVSLPYVRDGLFAPVSQDAQRLIAVDAFAKAQSLSMRFHLTRRTGALNRIIERGAHALDFLIRFLAFNIGPTLIELTIAAVVLANVFGLGVSVVVVLTVIGYIAFTLLVTEWRVRQRRFMNEKDTTLRAGSVDSLTNFETVKAFAAETRETARYDDRYREYSKAYVKQARSLALLNGGQELLMNLGLLAMGAMAVFSVSRGDLGPGDIAALVLILMNLYRPLNILGWAWREIKQGSVDLEKLYGLMAQEEEVADKPDAVDLYVAEGEITFEKVSFSHDGRSAGIVDVSFTAKAGHKLALVGPSGSGKSTLLSLVFRFFDTEQGRVLFDGQDVRDVTQKSLREALGLVPQDVVLFNDTLKENILYGRPEATVEELEQAASKAQLSSFIEALPDGWETRVGERGLKLSGGEKQRVGIARAILKDPAVLILDEATSALDSNTEAEVQAALEEASRGRTTIVVAHRLSTIRDADKIIVLNDGTIQEQGRHSELIKRGALYSMLWASQSAGKEDDLLPAE